MSGRNILVIGTFLPLLVLSGCGSLPGFGWMTSSSSTVYYRDTKWCVPGGLKRVLNRVSERYGPVTVSSTKRWWYENWRKGGASHSYHLKCKAVDFSVKGDPESVVTFLKSQPEVGGYKYYPSGHYHIDTGPRRTW
jgi:hypothetical protein